MSQLDQFWRVATLVLFCFCFESVAQAQMTYVMISQDGKTTLAKAGDTGETLFQNTDSLRVLEWSMTNHRITVVGKGEYHVPRPIFIQRPGISLVIDEGATVVLKNLSNIPPFAPRIPVIYNQGHDNVTVINLGTLVGQARKRGVGVFYDGRANGKQAIRGGRIMHAGMMGMVESSGEMRPTLNVIASLVDCQDVKVPLLFGDGYRIRLLNAEGCSNLGVGLAVSAPRASDAPLTLEGLNENTRVNRLVARQPLRSGVLVRNSPGTKVDESRVYGDPTRYTNVFNAHPYGPTAFRFSQRPFFEDSKGSRARNEKIAKRRVRDWPQKVELIDFPESLPKLKIKVLLDATFEDGGSDRVIDKVYDIELLNDTDFAKAGEFLFVTTDGKTIRAVGGTSGQIRHESTDARKVIEWAMAHSPVTVLKEGKFTVPSAVIVPRDNVSLMIAQNAELRQDPSIVPDPVAGGRGTYRPLIYNPHNHVEIINLGTLRPYAGHRSVAIMFDGRSDRTTMKYNDKGRQGTLNLDGGMIFATGPMYADDVVWLTDLKNFRMPLLLARGYTNTPLALEGVEDSHIGTVAALMGSQAFENEAMDFNGLCQRVRVGLVIGTMPTEEVIDVNNSRECVIDEVRVYRTVGDVMPVRIHNWPDNQGRSPKLASLRSGINHSKNLTSPREIIVEKPVSHWAKTVEIRPLTETLPQIKLRVRLTATFEDGTKEEIVNEDFDWEL